MSCIKSGHDCVGGVHMQSAVPRGCLPNRITNTYELACMNSELIEIINLLPHSLLDFNVDSYDREGRNEMLCVLNVSTYPCLCTWAACMKTSIL